MLVMIKGIIEDINGRNITRLCHFTNFTSALKILQSEKGIMASEFIDKDVYMPNDTDRYDGKKNFICCSIEYPNTWYLDRIRNKDPLFNEWIILFIDPYLAALEISRFCPVNAATGRGVYIRGGLQGFRDLFQQEIQIGRKLRRSTQMFDSCPTDGQAEVLVFKNVSRDDIIGLAVENDNVAKRISAALKILRKGCNIPDISIYIAPDLFINSWNPMIRAGRRPEEILFE